MALSALINRHLAPVQFPVEEFYRQYFQGSMAELVVRGFKDLMAVSGEEWRIGKGLRKLAGIDDSLVYDKRVSDRVKLMVKKEVYPQHLGSPYPKKARGIQYAVNERSAYEYAKEAYCIAKSVGSATQKVVEMGGVKFLIRYSATMSHQDIGKFADKSERLRRDYKCSWIDERDGQNWDSNVQRPHRLAVVGLYGMCDKALARHTLKGVDCRGVHQGANGRIEYETDGTVKSGHWDTSVGNSILNIEIAVQAILLLPLRLRPKMVRALVMGDDYLAWLYFDHDVDPVALRQALDDIEKGLGISPKRGIFADLIHASFISLTFYRTMSGTYCPLPKVGRMFSKLFWTVTPLAGRDPARLASGVAHHFYPLYKTWPPMRDFLRHHMQVAPIDCHDVFYQFQELGVKTLDEPIDWEQNHWHKYGRAGLGLQIGQLDGCEIVCDPIVRAMYVTDMSDPGERPGVVA